jgi:hypothetical protein
MDSWQESGGPEDRMGSSSFSFSMANQMRNSTSHAHPGRILAQDGRRTTFSMGWSSVRWPRAPGWQAVTIWRAVPTINQRSRKSPDLPVGTAHALKSTRIPTSTDDDGARLVNAHERSPL